MISRFAKSLVAVVTILVLVTMLSMFHGPSKAYIDPWTGQLFGEGGVEPHPGGKAFPPVRNAKGSVIMPKLGNETAKAELGRATWKLLHTMTLRFPKKPTQDEREALKSYFHLMSRLYPCGECAAEFQQLLKRFPPQTSSRLAASQWLCALHNEVNQRLHKPIFDCAHVDATYDCGCGDGDEGDATGASPKKKPTTEGGNGHDEIAEEYDEEEGVHDDLTGIDMIRGGKR